MLRAACHLALQWGGRVWMNPPYGKGVFQAFVSRLIAEVDSGHVTQALVLTSVHAMSAASSGQLLMRASVASCVLSGRLIFWGKNSTGNTPTFGSVVTALGPGLDVERFQRVWSPHGVISRVAPPSRARGILGPTDAVHKKNPQP